MLNKGIDWLRSYP